jgi:hypothetical protein
MAYFRRNRLLKKANVETVGKGGGWWRRAGAGGGSGVPAGRRRPGLMFAPFGGQFRDRGAGTLCFVLARAPHAVGRGTVRCRAGASHRWGGDVRGPYRQNRCAGDNGGTRGTAHSSRNSGTGSAEEPNRRDRATREGRGPRHGATRIRGCKEP